MAVSRSESWRGRRRIRVGCGVLAAAVPVGLFLLWLGIAFDWIEVENTDDLIATNGYSTLEEAAAVAGFHIPRPSDDYLFEFTYLEWYEDKTRPVSSTRFGVRHFEYPLMNPVISMLVQPSYHFEGGEKAARKGEFVTIGGRSGWQDTTYAPFLTFTFECGSVEDVIVWCQVDPSGDVSTEELANFVASLR